MIDRRHRSKLAFNSLSPSETKWDQLARIPISIYEGIINKLYNESRDYESVGEQALLQRVAIAHWPQCLILPSLQEECTESLY